MARPVTFAAKPRPAPKPRPSPKPDSSFHFGANVAPAVRAHLDQVAARVKHSAAPGGGS